IETAEVNVKMDPRVKSSVADLQKQFSLAVTLGSRVSSSSEIVLQARSIHEQLSKLENTTGSPIKESIESFDEKVSELLEDETDSSSTGAQAVALKDINEDLISLYKMVE